MLPLRVDKTKYRFNTYEGKRQGFKPLTRNMKEGRGHK